MDTSNYTIEDFPLDPTDDMTTPDDPADVQFEPDQPDSDFVKKQRRARGAVTYENKVRGLLNSVMRMTISQQSTVADAAAIIMYGPQLCTSLGDLAAEDARVRRSIDFIAGGADNPYAAVVVAAMPLVLQVLRNHEPVAEAPMKGIKIPFIKREIRFKFRIKLGKLRNLSHDPADFTAHVLSNPDVLQQLQKQGINVAGMSNGRSR